MGYIIGHSILTTKMNENIKFKLLKEEKPLLDVAKNIGFVKKKLKGLMISTMTMK